LTNRATATRTTHTTLKEADMEFDKWLVNKMPRRRYGSGIESALRMAWEAGAKNEREACAAMAEDTAAGRDAEAIAEAIRKRSSA